MTDDKKKEKGKAEEGVESTERTEDKVPSCGCDCIPTVKSE